MEPFLGRIMMAIGIMIAGLFGMCSFVGTLSLFGGGFHSNDLKMLFFFGYVPTLIGFAIFRAGHEIVDKNDSDRFDGR